MTSRLLLRDSENVSGDMLQRLLGPRYAWLIPISTAGYAAGQVGTFGSWAVTADGASLTLQIGPGYGFVQRDSGVSTMDPRALMAEMDTGGSVTLAAGGGSTRQDIVCLRIEMTAAADAIGSNLPTFGVVQGGVSPASPPADNALYLPLAQVAVPAGAVALTQGMITDLRYAPSATPGLVKLGETLLMAPAAAISFNNIPQNLRHLSIVYELRCDAAGVSRQDLNLRFNGDGSNNYDNAYIYQPESGALTGGAYASNSLNSLGVGQVTGALAPAGAMADGAIDISYYSGPNLKGAYGTSFARGATTSTVLVRGGHWGGSAPINSITLFPPAGSFVPGSVAGLYGRG